MKDRVKQTLDDAGAYWFMPVASGYNRSGIPDIISCIGGRFVAIETKSKFTKHGVTALQQRNLDDITKSGGVAMVINEDNLDDLINLIGRTK